jgi:hypothetical protein
MGEAAQGEHPIDPLFSGYISTLSGVIAKGGIPERRGRAHEKLEPPKAIVCFYEDFNRARFCLPQVRVDIQAFLKPERFFGQPEIPIIKDFWE